MVVSESSGQGQRTVIADFPFIRGGLAVPAFRENPSQQCEEQVMFPVVSEGPVGMNSTIKSGAVLVGAISRNLVCFTIQTKKKPSRTSTKTPRTSICELHLVTVCDIPRNQ